MRAFIKWPKRNIKRIGFGLVVIAISLIALLFRLNTLVPLSRNEKNFYDTATTHQILANPSDLPLKFLLWLVHLTPEKHLALFARLPIVFLALISISLLVYILHRWYGPRTAAFGFLIFISSAWFLHIGRHTGVDIEYLTAILTLIAVHIGLHDHDKKPLMLFTWLIANLVLLFIPGMLWFILLGIIWQHKEILNAWRNLNHIWQQVSALVISLLTLGAISLGIAFDTDLLKLWLGLPNHFASLHSIALQAAYTLGAFVYRGPHDPENWLGRLPILDAFISVMLIAGILFYIKHWRAARARLLLGYFILGVILVSIQGPVDISVIVPIIYIVAISGIAFILHYWLTVFPRNPLARGVGITVVSLVVGLSCTYNLEQYFLAWPHNPETTNIYHLASP